MKWLALSMAALLMSCAPKGPTVNKAQLLDMMNAFATSELGLTRITCTDEVFKNDPDVTCYSAPYDADEFMTRVDRLMHGNDLITSTGWRDDYGVASIALQYRHVPKEIGLQFERPNSFWDLPRYAELQRTRAQGQVLVGVSDDDPADRLK